MRTNRVPVALCIAALGGCALAPQPPHEEVVQQSMLNVTTPAGWVAPGAGAGTVADNWLSEFREPQLNDLVNEAIAYNADLRIAAARVDAAVAYLAAAQSPIWPQVNLVARGGGKMSGDSSGLSGIGLFASWELDVWGRVRSVARATELQYESAQLDAEYARQSIAALTAKGWILAIEARLQKAQAEASLQAALELGSLARDRLRVGSGDEFDVSTAQAYVESLRDTVQSLDLAYANALRALETLVGRYPASAVAVAVTGAPSIVNLIVAPGSAVPVSAAFDVIRSVAEAPVSTASFSVTVGGSAATDREAEAEPVLPAKSVWLAVTVCVPAVRPLGL